MYPASLYPCIRPILIHAHPGPTSHAPASPSPMHIRALDSCIWPTHPCVRPRPSSPIRQVTLSVSNMLLLLGYPALTLAREFGARRRCVAKHAVGAWEIYLELAKLRVDSRAKFEQILNHLHQVLTLQLHKKFHGSPLHPHVIST